MGRERRTLRGVELQADRVAEIAHRPVAELRRRDVAIALLSVPAISCELVWSICGMFARMNAATEVMMKVQISRERGTVFSV